MGSGNDGGSWLCGHIPVGSRLISDPEEASESEGAEAGAGEVIP